MNEPNSIGAFFERDHDRLDALFQSFQRWKRQDIAKAQDAFRELKFGLQRHIVWEEELLFPLWEEKTGMSEAGPTFVMRNEHRQIGAQLDAIHHKVTQQNSESDPEEQALQQLLGSHNLKEERVLYPSIDQVTTPEERENVFQKMKEIPEDRVE